jgi:hypothetical protein
MYFLDPRWGRRRRVLTRDKINRIKHKTSDAVGATSRDLKNRAYGIMAETRSLVSRKQVSDEVLAERVRARLGSLVSHASSIQVWSENGRITLNGEIVAAELERLVRGVAAIRGVTGVENHLSLREAGESIAPLGQSPGWRSGGEVLKFLRAPWPTTTRFLAGVAGVVLALGGALRRNVNGGTAALVGMALIARALSSASWLPFARANSESIGAGNGAPHHAGARNGEDAAE